MNYASFYNENAGRQVRVEILAKVIGADRITPISSNCSYPKPILWADI